MSIFFNFNELVIFVVVIDFHAVSLDLMYTPDHDNGVFMAGKQEGKPGSFKTAETLRGDKNKADINESRA